MTSSCLGTFSATVFLWTAAGPPCKILCLLEKPLRCGESIIPAGRNLREEPNFPIGLLVASQIDQKFVSIKKRITQSIRRSDQNA